eukprot:5785396-Pleurochrysis_carterae.AAC.1
MRARGAEASEMLHEEAKNIKGKKVDKRNKHETRDKNEKRDKHEKREKLEVRHSPRLAEKQAERNISD